MKKKTAPSPAVPLEVLPSVSVTVFPPHPRTFLNHADAFFMIVFRWAALVLSVAAWACSIGVMVVAAAVLLPALALGGVAWALHRTASIAR
jgi:hypothetical protein